jgi:ubiquinone/menaquinone biosynthesis C-methylase UbiE
LSAFTDPTYLREQQYRDDSNLRARMELHRRFSTNPEPWHRWAFDRFEFPPDARILEIGCGPGELWLQNIDRIPAGWELTLADLSPGMIEEARNVLGDRAACVIADAQELPFQDESFDGAIANHMLYHVPDRPRALREIARVLRPGALFYSSTNGGDHLREISALAQRESPWEFRLETAGPELEAVFEDVELELYPCDLEVTEVEPVVAFVRSLDHGEVDGLEERVEAVIERDGAFHVTKSSGLFRCRKP